MAIYNYVCLDCQKAATKIKGSDLTVEEMFEVIFETSHSMQPTPKERKEASECPRCKGHNTEITLLGVDIAASYVRGNGYLDKAGCHRDMNLHKLVNDDPYAEYRVPGEVEDMKKRLQKSGQHNPKPTYFINQDKKK